MDTLAGWAYFVYHRLYIAAMVRLYLVGLLVDILVRPDMRMDQRHWSRNFRDFRWRSNNMG